jgi:hypothetical protein
MADMNSLNNKYKVNYTIDDLRRFYSKMNYYLLRCISEMADYCMNEDILKPGGIVTEDCPSNMSYLAAVMSGLTKKNGMTGRKIPILEEFPDPPLDGESFEYPFGNSSINLDDDILVYQMSLMPFICKSGNDGKYDELAHSVAKLLSAISWRNEGGIFMGDYKFSEETEAFMKEVERYLRPSTPQAAASAIASMTNMVTKPGQEARILEWVCDTVSSDEAMRRNISPEKASYIFSSYPMPFNKIVQLRRIVEVGKRELEERQYRNSRS